MRKILAILLSITFVCNIAAESVYGVVLPAVANNQYNINKNFSVGNFNTANDNLVLLIQDLHCHYDTQVKISELLRNISKQDNFNKIFVEGASADITGSFIKSLPENIKNPLIENLLKEGKLNGAEYFFLTNDTVVPLYALENEELYSQSGEGLQYILNAQKEVDKIISEMDRELKASQRQNLSGSSRKMLSAVNKYENKKLEQSRYYKYLIKEAKKQKINLNKYREILSVADIETKINAKKVQKELNEYLDKAKTELPYQTYKALTEGDVIANIASISSPLAGEDARRAGEGSPLSLSNYKELSKYIALYEYENSSDPLSLYKEERNLFAELLIKSADNKEIETVILSLAFSKFKRVMENKATDAEFKYIKDFKVENINKLWDRTVNTETFKKMLPYFYAYNEYYLANETRNEEFADRIIKGINKEKPVTAVITGGFHTEELKQILLSKGLSVSVLTPKITGGIKAAQEKYIRLFIEQEAEEEAFFEAKIAGGAVEARTLAQYLRTGDETELFKILNDINVLHEQKVFGAITKEEILKAIIDTYNETYPSEKVSSEDGRIKNIAAGLKKNGYGLKPASVFDALFKNKNSRFYKAYTILAAPLAETFLIFGLAALINPLAAGAVFVASHILADIAFSKDKKETLAKIKSHLNWRFLLVSAALTVPFAAAMLNPAAVFALSFGMHGIYNYAVLKFKLQDKKFPLADAFDDIFDDDELESRIMVISLDSKASPGLLKHMLSIAKIDFDMNKGHFLFAEVVNRNVMGQVEIPGLEKRFIENDIRIPELSARIRQSKDKTALIAAEVKYGKIQRVFLKNDSGKYKLVKGLPWEFLPEYKAANGKVIFAVDDSKTPEMPAAEQKQGGIKEVYNGKLGKEAARRREYVNITVTNENTKEEKEYSVPLEGIANAEAPKDLNLNEGRHTIRGIPADNINASAGIFGFKREGLSSSLKKFAGENAVTAIETQDGEIIKVFAMNKSGEYEQIWSVFDGVTILDLRAGKEISFSEWEKMTPEERGKGRYGIDGILNGNKKGKIRFPGVEETEIPELKKFTEKGEAIISVEAQGGKVIKVSVMNEDEEKYEQIWISEAYSSSLQNGAEYKAPSKPEKKEEASGKSKNNNPAESVASAPLPSRKKQSPAVKKQSKTDTTTDGRLKPADSKAGKFDITAANADTKEEKTYSVFGVVVVADVVKNLNLSEGRHIIGGIPVGKKNASKSIFGFEREGLSSKLKEFAGEDSITITALETYDGEIIKVWALDRNEENPKYEQVWSVFDEATITNSSAKRKISLSDWENMMPQERGKRYYKIDEILNGNKKGKIIFPKVEETEIPELKEFTANGEVMISIKLRGGKIIEVSVREKHKESYRQIWAAETAAVFSSSLENGTEYESSESPKPPVNLIKKQEQERVSDSVSPETDVKKDKPFEKTPEPESENKETAPEKPKYSLIEQLLAKAMAKDGKPDNKIQPAANLDLAADKSEVKIERLEDKKDSDNIITAATKPAAAGHKKLSNKAVKTSAKIKKVGRRRYDKQSDVTISRRYDKESGVTITDLLDPDKGIISYSKMREIISEWKTMKPQERKGRYEVKGISSNNQRGVIKFLGMEQSVPKSKRAILLAEKTVSIVIEPGATEKVFGEIKEIYTENETGSGIYNVRLYPERYIEITNLAAKSKGEKEHTRMYPAWGRGTDAPKDLWDLTTGHYLIKGAFAEKEGLIRFLNFRQQIFKLGKYMEDEAITSAEIAFEAQDGEIIEVWVWNENTQDYELIKPGVGGMTITDLETGKELFYPELQKIISGWKTMKPQERKGHYEVKGIAKKQNIKFLGMHKTIPEAKLGNLSEGKTIAIVVEPGATEKVFGEIKEIYEEEIAGSGEYNVRLYPEKYIEITDLAAKERGEKEHTRMYPAWSVGTHIPKNLPNMATGEYLIRGRFNKSTYGTVTFPGISKRREISKLGELVEKAMEESKDGVMLAIETQDGEMIKVSLDDEDAKYIPLLIAGGQNGNSDFSDIFSLNSETFIVDEKTGDITVLADRKKMTNREREYLAVKAKEGVKIKVVIAMPTENEVSILGKMYPVSAIKKLLKNPEESIAVVIQNGEIKEVFTKDASGQYVIPHAAIFSKLGLKSVNPIVQFISNPFTSPVWETAYLAVLSLINPVAGYLAFFASHIIADTLILKEGETRVEALKKTLKAHSDWRFLFGSFFIALPFMVLPFVTFGIFPIAIAMMFSFIIHEGYNALAVKYGFTPASVLSILETKEETIEDIIDSYIRTVPEVKPELLAEFARRNALSPEKLQVVFNEHGNEEWFQDIFYGMLEANELERIDYVTSKVGVGISKNLVNFVLAIRGNFDEFKETIVKKYKDEPWFRDILSGGYYIHRLNAKGIENIDEILKKLRIKNSQGLISCANEINTDLLDERKKTAYIEIFSQANVGYGAPRAVMELISRGKLSFKELVVKPEEAKYHNINGTEPENINKLREDLLKVKKIIAPYHNKQYGYRLSEFFEIRTNYALDELLESDDRLRVNIDEIIDAVYDIKKLLKGQKQDTGALDAILAGYSFVGGSGIEYSLSGRSIRNYAIGDITGDCTGANHGSAKRKNYKSERLMSPDCELLQVFIDGDFTNRFDFIAGKAGGKPAIFIHAQEDISQFRDGTSSLMDRRDIAYYKALEYLIKFAGERGFEEVYISLISNSEDIFEKGYAISDEFGGKIDIAHEEIIWPKRNWRLVLQEKVKEKVSQEESLLGENKYKASKLRQIKSLMENGFFASVYVKDGEYVIPVSNNTAIKFADEQENKKILNFINISDADLKLYEDKQFGVISAREKKSLVNSGISANFNTGIFNSLNALSISTESLFGEKNADKLTAKLRLLADWSKLYKLGGGSYAAVIGETENGKQVIVKFARNKDEQLKLAGKIDETREKITESDKEEDTSVKNRIKGILLSREARDNGFGEQEFWQLVKDGNFKVYRNNSYERIMKVSVGDRILKFRVEAEEGSIYKGELEIINPEELSNAKQEIDEGTRVLLYNARIPSVSANMKEVDVIEVSIKELVKSRIPAGAAVKGLIAPVATIFYKLGLKSDNLVIKFISKPFTSPVWETAYLAALSLINPVIGYLVFFASHIIADTLILKEGETRVEALKKTLKAHLLSRKGLIFIGGTFAIASPFMVLPFVSFPLAFAMILSFIIHEGYNAVAIKYGWTPAGILAKQTRQQREEAAWKAVVSVLENNNTMINRSEVLRFWIHLKNNSDPDALAKVIKRYAGRRELFKMAVTLVNGSIPQDREGFNDKGLEILCYIMSRFQLNKFEDAKLVFLFAKEFGANASDKEVEQLKLNIKLAIEKDKSISAVKVIEKVSDLNKNPPVSKSNARLEIKGTPAEMIKEIKDIFGVEIEETSVFGKDIFKKLKEFAGKNAAVTVTVETYYGEVIKVLAMKDGKYEQAWSTFDWMTITDPKGNKIPHSDWENMPRKKGIWKFERILTGNKNGRVKLPKGIDETEISGILKEITAKGEAVISVETRGLKPIKLWVMNDDGKYKRVWTIPAAKTNKPQNQNSKRSENLFPEKVTAPEKAPASKQPEPGTKAPEVKPEKNAEKKSAMTAIKKSAAAAFKQRSWKKGETEIKGENGQKITSARWEEMNPEERELYTITKYASVKHKRVSVLTVIQTTVPKILELLNEFPDGVPVKIVAKGMQITKVFKRNSSGEYIDRIYPEREISVRNLQTKAMIYRGPALVTGKPAPKDLPDLSKGHYLIEGLFTAAVNGRIGFPAAKIKRQLIPELIESLKKLPDEIIRDGAEMALETQDGRIVKFFVWDENAKKYVQAWEETASREDLLNKLRLQTKLTADEKRIEKEKIKVTNLNKHNDEKGRDISYFELEKLPRKELVKGYWRIENYTVRDVRGRMRLKPFKMEQTIFDIGKLVINSGIGAAAITFEVQYTGKGFRIVKVFDENGNQIWPAAVRSAAKEAEETIITETEIKGLIDKFASDRAKLKNEDLLILMRYATGREEHMLANEIKDELLKRASDDGNYQKVLVEAFGLINKLPPVPAYKFKGMQFESIENVNTRQFKLMCAAS